MTKKGRPALPVPIKELQGTFRPDRERHGVKFALVTSVPKPEVWLSNKGKRNFKSLCELLINHKLLDVASVPLVVQMAESWAEYEEATKTIKAEGSIILNDRGHKVKHPAIAIRNDAAKLYKETSAMFGLDLLSSQKINPLGKEDEDEFSKLMKAYKAE